MSIEEFEGALKGKLCQTFAAMGREHRCGQLKVHTATWERFASNLSLISEFEACINGEIEYNDVGVRVINRKDPYCVINDIPRLGKFLDDCNLGFHLIPADKFIICCLQG